MKCEECNETKENQKFDDVCNICVNKLMKKLWDTKISPKIEEFLKQVKDDK